MVAVIIILLFTIKIIIIIYNFILGNFSIGLNETQLGIAAPSWFVDTFRNTVGHRTAERMLALGLMIKSDEALKIGLVDEVVAKDKVIEHTNNVRM